VTRSRFVRHPALLAVALGLTTALVEGCSANAYYSQSYLPADHNQAFRDRYPRADRFFNAFDYGHARLSELLYTQPDEAATRLEHQEFDWIVKRLLVDPPKLPLDGEAIEPSFSRFAPEVHEMFEWSHMLHRQVYDILADDRIPPDRKDDEVARVVRYYRSRHQVAFSTTPKDMALMDGQPYSGAFRAKAPKFNGLIWAYHWMQVAVYEALLTGHTPEQLAGREVDRLRRRRRLPVEVALDHRDVVPRVRGRVAVHGIVVEDAENGGHGTTLLSDARGERLESAST